ncbi:MAG TPA: Calx-beta domain-containing protein [Pyrinomonadaceae bacterium]|nr:Calx-beta domain-containing protein [Pyrinomonadaceae bacterium]
MTGDLEPLKDDAANENPGALDAGGATPPKPTEVIPPTFCFSEASYRVNKDESASAVIAVIRKGNLDAEASVGYSTEDATALAVTHYTPASGTLNFLKGESRKQFTVQIKEDAPGRSAYFNLKLENPTGAQLGSPSEAVLTIMSGDMYRKHTMNPLLRVFNDRLSQRVIKHVLLVLALIGGTHLLSEYITNKAETYSTKWSGHLTPKSVPELFFPANSVIAAAEQQRRLQEQVARIRERLALHLDVMNFYYTRYYMAIITFSIAAGVAGIILVLISKRGWEQTNEYVITSFLVMAAASVFYGAFPGVFQQEQNIVDNKVLYLKYLALENEVFSYAVTGEALNYDATRKDLETSKTASTSLQTGQATSIQSAVQTTRQSVETTQTQKPQSTINGLGIAVRPPDFIHYIDLQLAQDNIAIGFDYKQIPNYKNAFDTNK